VRSGGAVCVGETYRKCVAVGKIVSEKRIECTDGWG